MALNAPVCNLCGTLIWTMPLWLNETDVRALLPPRDLIEIMETAVSAYSQGGARQPVRTVIALDGGFFASMPASLATPAALGAKLVTVVAANAARSLPTHLATIVLLDPSTGALLAVMDGRWITEMRTAAVSAVAARYLAREDASELAIIGSGVQARSHLEALCAVRRFTAIRCWSPTAANLARFCGAAREYAVHAADSAAGAVRGADVVVLATAASAPVIRDPWVKRGACVLSVGACRPDQREMDPALVARARVFVDSRAGALSESGDIAQGIAEGRFTASHIAAELGEVAAGASPGRRSGDEVVIFKSLGMAVEDLAAAELAYRRALERGRGVPLV